MSGLDADLGLRHRDGFTLDVSLHIESGETVALLGPNGAGKSTVVAALAGLLPLETGRVLLDDTVLDEPETGVFVDPGSRSIGIVFQELLLFPHMSVIDNVSFGLRARGVGRQEANEVALRWIDEVGLGGLGGRRPSELSGGEAQRVAVARALAIEPRLLLLDEPLSSLDVTTRTELRRSLRAHLETFTGPRLVITHDPAEAFILADRIVVMEAGLITQIGTAEEIRLRPRTAYAADLVGSNLIRGEAQSGVVHVDRHPIQTVDSEVAGPVLLNIHPHSVSIHRARPEGSHRNVWKTSIQHVEPLWDRVRVGVGEPVPLTSEVTGAAAHELGLAPGVDVWVAVKATEIGVEPV